MIIPIFSKEGWGEILRGHCHLELVEGSCFDKLKHDMLLKFPESPFTKGGTIEGGFQFMKKVLVSDKLSVEVLEIFKNTPELKLTS